jgi:hypothetical protein
MNIIIKTCIDNKCLMKWTGEYTERGYLSSTREPAIYIMPPYLLEHHELAPIIYDACIDPPLFAHDQYVRPASNTGLSEVSWSGISRYVPLDQWLPHMFRDWGILVVAPSAQDAPFRTSTDFAKHFTQSLHDDCASFLGGHAMMTWSGRARTRRQSRLTNHILSAPGPWKTIDPGLLKTQELGFIRRCTYIEQKRNQ